MNLLPSNRRANRFVWGAVVLIVVGALLAPSVFAKLALNTIDPIAIVSQGGSRIRVTGPIEVTAGELCQQRVTVTQRSTGAVAEGYTQFRGTGVRQQWEVVVAAVHGGEKFVPGPATAVGLARTTARGKATDAHQWLVEVNLVAK